MTEKIHLTDLAKPKLTAMQQGAVEYAETLTITLGSESIMREAEEATGLSDWGPDDFLPRLELLCNEWDSQQELRPLGRLSLRNKLLQHATSRLLIQQQWSAHPEILELEISQPIIVVGLPRSGTTHMLNLLAADSRFRSLPLWESYEPVPMPGETLLADGTDPRWQRCDQQWQAMQSIAELVASMHPMDPDHIHEELELMGPNFGSYNYEWLCHSPRWRDHYYATDQTSQYEYMRDVLKLLTWQQRDTDRPTRWVLKCPQHLEQLPVLKSVFPDATVVVTQRDPLNVLASTISMQAYSQRTSRERVMMSELLEYWTDRIDHLLQACVRDRPIWSPEQSIDVPFKEFIRDDISWIEKIYQKAGVEMTATAQKELAEFLDRKRGAYGNVAFDIETHFGADMNALRERFRYYTDSFMQAGH